MGLISAVLIFVYLRNTASDLEKKYANASDEATLSVVVANADLPEGTIVSNDNMSIRPMPRGYLHNNVLTPDQMEGIFGRKLAEPLAAGKPLLTAFLERPAPQTFSSRLVTGTRAITLTVDEINSISGLLRAGDHIDLLFTPRTGQAGEQMVMPIMQDVVVRATGQMMMEEVQARRRLTAMGGDDEKRSAYSTITLEVSQFDAGRLVLAQTQGHLTAVLRGTEDRIVGANTKVGIPELMGTEYKPPPLLKVAQEFDDVEFLIGGQGGFQRSVFHGPKTVSPDKEVTLKDGEAAVEKTAALEKLRRQLAGS
ncbi:MAG: Flp pilus assembly protein CpaB [Pseudomonadota bacterium]